MNDVAASIVLIAAIAAPTATVAVVALKRYQTAHGEFASWRREGQRTD